MLKRILEPEVMDSEDDAREYDSMDHSAVNALFASDLLSALADWSLATASPERLKRPVHRELNALDLGAGTAQIPIELCRREANLRVVAVDAAESMLAVGWANVAAARLGERIELVLADAKRLPFPDSSFPIVVSNSIVHHIAEPREVLAEAVRVAEPGAPQFHRDLCRPQDEAELARIVATYAGDATPFQAKLFSESLRAALTVAEVQSFIVKLGFAADTVRMTSDRHWTWIASG